MFTSFWKMSFDMMMLTAEAQGVIAQRTMMFALRSPKAQAETQLATGASLAAIVNGYRRKVRANSRRLGR